MLCNRPTDSRVLRSEVAHRIYPSSYQGVAGSRCPVFFPYGSSHGHRAFFSHFMSGSGRLLFPISCVLLWLRRFYLPSLPFTAVHPHPNSSASNIVHRAGSAASMGSGLAIAIWNELVLQDSLNFNTWVLCSLTCRHVLECLEWIGSLSMFSWVNRWYHVPSPPERLGGICLLDRFQSSFSEPRELCFSLFRNFPVRLFFDSDTNSTIPFMGRVMYWKCRAERSSDWKCSWNNWYPVFSLLRRFDEIYWISRVYFSRFIPRQSKLPYVTRPINCVRPYGKCSIAWKEHTLY